MYMQVSNTASIFSLAATLKITRTGELCESHVLSFWGTVEFSGCLRESVLSSGNAVYPEQVIDRSQKGCSVRYNNKKWLAGPGNFADNEAVLFVWR